MRKFVISVGGSIIVPEDVNVSFIKKFKKEVLKYINDNVFYFVIGGGKTCRKYQKSLKDLGVQNEDQLDWIGIKTTHLNARFMAAAFGDSAEQNIIVDPDKLLKTSKKVVFGGGWKPGWSTDYVAVRLATKLGIQTVINLSNIDYVYDKDPRVHNDAHPLKNVSWADFGALVGHKWKPGANLPFDPIACKLAEKEGISVIIMNGLNLANFRNFLLGKKFKGTVVG